MRHKVGVHFQPVLVGIQMYPIRFQVGHAAAFLQEQNVGSDLCTGCGLEGIIGQTDSTEKVGSLGNVLSDGRILLVHGALAGDESYHTTRAHLIQSAGKEIVINKKIELVVFLIQNLERPKGHIVGADTGGNTPGL